MRIVLTPWGSLGDLHPYLAVGLELKQRGHDVLIATSGIYREKVEGEGFRFHPVRPEMGSFFEQPDRIAKIMESLRGSEYLFRGIIMPAIRDMYVDLADAAVGADFLVSHVAMCAAPVVAEKLQIPWASVALQPATLWSAYDPSYFPISGNWLRLSTSAAQSYFGFIRRVTERWAQPLYQLRKHLSLPENKHPLFEGQFSPWGTLALFSPVFAAPQPDWPDGTIATGFAFYDKHTPDCDGLSRTMRAFLDSGPPPIVFTLGSSAAYAPGPFYETAAVAATKLGKRAILLAGMDYRNRISVRSGGDVLVEEYAPFSKLFPHAVAIVHSGGIGTTAQVLRAGKPSIVTPFSHDQPDNGARIQRIRAGAVLPKWRLGPHALSRTLDRLLSNNEVSANAAEIGTLIRAESGARAAADALERMASGHKPFSAAARM